MSGKRVLALYAVILFGFAVVLCRIYFLAQNPAYAARAEAQSTVSLALPTRRGNFYDCNGLPLTGLEMRWQTLCFPGENNYPRLYSETDSTGQATLYQNRNRAAPFLLETMRDLSSLGLRCFPAAKRYASVPLCQHLIGYLDADGHGAAGLEKALDDLLAGTGAHDTLRCAVTAQGRLREGETPQLIQNDSGAVGVQLTISRPVQRAAEAVAAETMTSGALGRVFADPFGMTAKQLLTVPTVLELADFSEEATAFLMNILMFRFQSYLQRLPESSALQRLIVLEEAHNVFRKTDAEDSALARSNLAFDKMFAEIRASGTGLVLSDQRPSLMPDSVMANTAVKLCLGMDSGEDRGCMGSVMDLSVLQRRALHAFRPGECLMTVRGTHGVFHLQTEKPGTSGSFTAACLVCGSRFRCRKSAVQGLLAPLDAGQMQYHLARIRADPYNISVLAENIEQMLQQLRITAAAPTKLCLLGEMLAGAGVPLGESRQIVTAYHNHLKGGTV